MRGSPLLVLGLLGSMILNTYMIVNELMREDLKLSWSQKAAIEAEAVASLKCSGHGRAYLDSLLLDGKPVCECNTCYSGSDCSLFLTDCATDANSGNPLFLEPFWMQHAGSGAVLVSSWHRMGYTYEDKTYISQELLSYIHRLHAYVGNAVTQGRYILFGAGSTQLLNAAVHALSSNSSSPARVVASIPFYSIYKSQTELFRSLDYEFEGDTSLWKNNMEPPSNFVEFVTSPNNPDGKLRKSVLEGSSVKTIHDYAYYWPHFTPIPSPADEDVMIFSISKITGHASSRFGWAIIKDEAVYERMVWYMILNTMGASRDTQLRALKLLKAVLEDGGSDLFEFGYETTRSRWEKMSNTIARSKRFSIQKLEPQYCTYFKKIREPSPAYAWLKCEREEDEDCNGVLLSEGGIIGREGRLFGAESRYARLSLIRSQDDFDLLLQRIDALVSKEDYGAKTVLVLEEEATKIM